MGERWKLLKVHEWLHRHSLKLLAIRDTPEAIAGGVAIGIFFGFTPLFGLKTILAIFLAWLTRSNILAAVIAGALHDVILPLMPVVFYWEYGVGHWLLTSPHEWPKAFKRHGEGHWWHSWTSFISVGKPLLLGSGICAAPVAVLSFFITRRLVDRHQRKKHAHAVTHPSPDKT